ncbi:MAG TPA: hypothetical protein VEK55_18020 [Xanthobacteraceae bacterium]|nr:hypothetical protein [Xanthobacteraceae bacterium]
MRIGTLLHCTSHLFDTEILVSSFVAPKPLREFEALKSEAIKAAAHTADAYIQNWTRYVIAQEEFGRGRMNEARDAALELMQLGRRLDDPRSTGLGLSALAWIALTSESFAEALEYSEQSLAVAIAPWDQNLANCGKGIALVLLRQTEEGAKVLEAQRRWCLVDGDLATLTITDGGLSKKRF